MKPDFAQRFTGGALAAAALMGWLGWLLLPIRPGPYFEPEMFGKIHGQFHLWIWLYRLHIFGLVTYAVGLVALGTLVTGSEARVLIWPGVAVAVAGTFVGALAEAFYYHHGAWGALELAGQRPPAARAFVESLRTDTEYVTCLTRFSRVFGGLGLGLLAWGLLRGRLLPAWLAVVAGLLGLAAMALTMGLPDRMGLYRPVFHLHALWLLVTGLVIWRGGWMENAEGAPSRGGRPSRSKPR